MRAINVVFIASLAGAVAALAACGSSDDSTPPSTNPDASTSDSGSNPDSFSGSSSSGGNTDASSSGANPDSGGVHLGPTCGPATCAFGQVCCVTPGAELDAALSGTCEDPAACTAGIALACTQAVDCPMAGTNCCGSNLAAAGGTSSCQAVAICPDQQLCNGKKECPNGLGCKKGEGTDVRVCQPMTVVDSGPPEDGSTDAEAEAGKRDGGKKPDSGMENEGGSTEAGNEEAGTNEGGSTDDGGGTEAGAAESGSPESGSPESGTDAGSDGGITDAAGEASNG